MTEWLGLLILDCKLPQEALLVGIRALVKREYLVIIRDNYC